EMRVHLVHVHVADETAVNLEEVDVEGLEVGKGTGALAEVVQRHPAAQPPHRLHETNRSVEVSRRRGFGDLEADARRIEAMPLEAATDVADEFPVAQRSAGKIDAD